MLKSSHTIRNLQITMKVVNTNKLAHNKWWVSVQFDKKKHPVILPGRLEECLKHDVLPCFLTQEFYQFKHRRGVLCQIHFTHNGFHIYLNNIIINYNIQFTSLPGIRFPFTLPFILNIKHSSRSARPTRAMLCVHKASVAMVARPLLYTYNVSWKV